nr:MAG TPA_asm: hypothetical protein [Caudoviricetes sp.]
MPSFNSISHNMLFKEGVEATESIKYIGVSVSRYLRSE